MATLDQLLLRLKGGGCLVHSSTLDAAGRAMAMQEDRVAGVFVLLFSDDFKPVPEPGDELPGFVIDGDSQAKSAIGDYTSSACDVGEHSRCVMKRCTCFCHSGPGPDDPGPKGAEGVPGHD